MSQYQTLKTQIKENIKQNGEGAIRGDILQTQLLDMINALGTGYQFMGVATPTNPGSAQTPDYKCFYLATTPGTYTNLGGLVVADGEVALLKYDSSWTKEATGIASQEKLNQLYQEIDLSIGNYSHPDIVWEDGYRIFDGQKVADQYFAISQPIAVSKGDIIITDQRYAGNMNLFTQYDNETQTYTRVGPSTIGFVRHKYSYIVEFDGYLIIGKSLENNRYWDTWVFNDSSLGKDIAAKSGKLLDLIAANTETISNHTTQIAENTTDITSLKKISGSIRNVQINNWLTGGIKPDGLLVNDPAGYFFHSAPISLKRGQTITLNTRISVVAVISTCDSAGTVFSPVVINRGYSFYNYSYTAVEDCYVTVSVNTDTQNYPIYIVEENLASDGTVGYLENVLKIIGEREILTPTWNDGYIVKTDGQKIADPYFSVTSPIPVSKGDIIFTDLQGNGPMSVIGTCNSTGTEYTPKVQYDGRIRRIYTYVVEEDGYVYICKSLEGTKYWSSWIIKGGENGLAILSVIKNLGLDNIATDIEEIKEELSEKDYSYYPPLHILGIDSRGYGREYVTSLYPESITTLQMNWSGDLAERFPRIRLNGNRKLVFQQRGADYDHRVTTETHTIKIGAKGLKEYTFDVNYVRAKRTNAQNHPIFLLCLGDSITNQAGYQAYTKMFAEMDNTDIGNISLINLGSYLMNEPAYGGDHIEYEYNGQTHQVKKYTEGRAGWTTYGMANWPFYVRLDCGSLMWYLAGLATKTPFNSSTPGQTFEEWTGSAAQRCEAVAAVCGRFKPDYCEELWNRLHDFHSIFERSGEHTIWYYSTGSEYTQGESVPAYNSSTSDAIMADYISRMFNNPDNVFFDIDYARAYTGDYVWTNKIAFNINKWLERYRTLDDNGNQLSLDSPNIGTKVTADTITNPVCTPNFIIETFGTNDNVGVLSNGFSEYYAGMYEALTLCTKNFLDTIKAQVASAFVGYGMPRASGVYYPEDWNDIAYPKRVDVSATWPQISINNRAMDLIGALDITKAYNYVPIFHTCSPLSGRKDKYVEDFDNQNKILVSGADVVHPDVVKEKSIAYQVLAWIYWCLQ